jgi:mannosyl-3-phosphoglycerate phosphatase
MKKNHLLISTDLDGTLLDHYTYSWQAALPAIEKLQQLNCEIIINTSKTFDEVVLLQQKIGISAPFIVENGSAIYSPVNHITSQKFDHYDDAYTRKVLGKEINVIKDVLHELRTKNKWNFEGYSDWTIATVIEHTGLTKEDATRSHKRQFSEPILWHDNEDNFSLFCQAIEKNNLRVIRGGRFIHILGQSNKGKALHFLQSTLYDKNPPKLVCLGDSYNDLDMLHIADIPVLVRSPAHDFPPHQCLNPVIYTEAYGPEGWLEAFNQIINQSELHHGRFLSKRNYYDSTQFISTPTRGHGGRTQTILKI